MLLLGNECEREGMRQCEREEGEGERRAEADDARGVVAIRERVKASSVDTPIHPYTPRPAESPLPKTTGAAKMPKLFWQNER